VVPRELLGGGLLSRTHADKLPGVKHLLYNAIILLLLHDCWTMLPGHGSGDSSHAAADMLRNSSCKWLPTPEQLLLSGGPGCYCNEVVMQP
jgi:hypothetical protein